MGLLCLAYTENAFDAVIAGMNNCMCQQCRLADENHQYCNQTYTAYQVVHVIKNSINKYATLFIERVVQSQPLID